ncbi:MAG: Hsp20/alpha crystallin family protein [Leptonema illini]|jgi:HSP20 family protein|uniref:Heat shock protein Hsp20 n=2 Tax=Leptonema illini TaxID=183 RepID=H2CK69_9LEPT|nr:Hsp20/alpha crystallin family protein [Leptonema illini]EHQ07172.1 heat shock protein Hsp20 [Leptonema illini DSM 21528]KAB2930869.1 MAG: Hsp20/alpha crystallin family protein [Leptonema illini]
MKDLIPEWAKDRSELMRRDMEQYFNNMQREMDRLFSPLMGRMQSGLGEAETFMRKFMPAVNVSEDEKQIIVKAELPGLEAKDVEVSVADDRLTIEGEKKFEKKSDKEDVHLMESAYGAFKRVIALPDSVDFSKVEATFKNGILTVQLPKKADATKPSKKVDVKQA